MEHLQLTDIWTPAGVILGFQMTLFFWRLQREVAVGDKGSITWFAVSDYLGIAASLCLVAGVFLLPLSGVGGAHLAASAFGLGVTLFVGHFLGLCGHYEMFDPSKPRSGDYFPLEKIVVGLAVIVAIAYSAALYSAA